jgi:hypothetical protein
MSSSGMLKALYYLASGVPVVGLLQARRERKPGFQVPGTMGEDVVGELESKCVVQLVSSCVVSVFPSSFPSFSSPCGRGGSSPFYRSRREQITCAPRYLAT